MEKKIINALLFAYILCFIGVQSSIQYIDQGMTGGIVPFLLRDKVVSTGDSESLSYSQWIEKGSHNNKGNKAPQTFSYSYTETTSRSFSIGSGITKTILSYEVNLSIGGELSWEKSDTLSGEAEVPGYKVAHAYMRNQIKTTKIKHVIQRQKTDIAGNWKDSGSQKTSISTIITKTPQIKIDIEDN